MVGKRFIHRPVAVLTSKPACRTVIIKILEGPMEQCLEWRDTRCGDVWAVTVDEPKEMIGLVRVTLVRASRITPSDRIDLTITSVNGFRWLSLEPGEETDIILDNGQCYLVRVKFERAWRVMELERNIPMAKLEFISDNGFKVRKWSR